MKHSKFLLVIIAAVFILLQCQPVRAEQISRYPVYDTRTTRLIFDELKAAEESQETAEKWLSGEIQHDEAVGELKAYRDRVRQVNSSIQELDVSPALKPFHSKVVKFSSRIKKLLEDDVKVVQETDVTSKGDMKNLLEFMETFSNSFLELQLELNTAACDIQKKYNFSRESKIIRTYYKWNIFILSYDIKSIPLQKALSGLVTKAIVQKGNFDEISGDLKKLKAEVSSMMSSINNYKAPPELQELHSMWLEGYNDFEAVIKLFEEFLNAPTKENYKKMSEMSKIITEKSIKLGEYMIKFQEKNFKI